MTDQKTSPTGSSSLPAPFHADANGVNVVGMRWCIQLNFGTPIVEKDAPMDYSLAHINLNWPLAKALHLILGATIENYEKLEGTINLPKSFLTEVAVSPATPAKK